MFSVHNSLTGKVEAFKSLQEGRVGMYNCGPTVYDYVHIGNLRAFLTADLLRRTLEYLGYEVRQIMNITDVGIGGNDDEGEDKIIRGLKREGKSVTMEAMKELGEFYTERFKEDAHELNFLPPHEMPRASEHITEDIELIKILEEKGFTYQTSDGIYFDTSKDPNYGRLGGTGGEESRIGERSEKRNRKDFALWKFNSNLGYPSPWGQGFPGWHIECSAMARKYLGESFDIHTGGADLRPIHHNNEIAQSESACGCEFARYWLHNEFVILGTEKMAQKMSKSEGNTIKLKDLEERGVSPLAYRYLLLQSHYRMPTTFSWDALEAAQNAYRKLKELVASLPEGGDVDETYKKIFTEALEEDLGTPEALAVAWRLAKDDAVPGPDKRATLLDFDKVLGLRLSENEFAIKDIPEEVVALLSARESARAKGDFATSDALREEIKNLGYAVEDSSSGQKISRV